MSTSAQIAANRENAQLSTGPTSADGKAKSSHNATRHGGTAKKAVILEDEHDEYKLFVADLDADLQPHGPLQHVLFDSIVDAAWRLRRLRLAEVQLQDELPDHNDPLLVEACHKKLTLYALYTQRAERSFHKSLDQLRKVQTEVQYRIESQPRSETERTTHDESPLIEFQKICPLLARELARDAKTQERREHAELMAYLNAPMPTLNPKPAQNEKTKPIPMPQTAAAAR